MERRDWLTVAIAVVAAAAVIGVYAVMSGQSSRLRTQLSRVTTERNALLASKNEGAAQLKELTKERDRLQGRIAAMSTQIGKLKASPVVVKVTPEPVPTAASQSAGTAAVSSSFGPGVYLVGSDISAGRYKGSVTGGVPYWCVSRDANQQDIVANGIPSGQFYVSVRDGQYLLLQDVELN